MDELNKCLNKDGFHVSQFIHDCCQDEAIHQKGRHISTVPVKLICSQNDSLTKDIDGNFCAATLLHLEELLILRPNELEPG